VRVPGAVRLPRRYARMILIRGLALWILARVMVFAIAMFLATMTRSDVLGAGDLLRGANVVVAAWAIAMSAALVLLDLHRRHEIALLNNLGVTTATAVVLGSVPAAVMETFIRLLLP
jgi:hypothetical protein